MIIIIGSGWIIQRLELDNPHIHIFRKLCAICVFNERPKELVLPSRRLLRVDPGKNVSFDAFVPIPKVEEKV